MTQHIIDQATWPRADHYRLFRGYQRPHYATTARLDVTRLIAAKPIGLSPYRACLYAIGAGLHGVEPLRTRFQGDTVTIHDQIQLSMTVPTAHGTFNYAYVPWQTDWPGFDTEATDILTRAARNDTLDAHAKGLDVAYLSCMPWLDYTSISNALPGPDDCIPRVTWGKFTATANGWDMAMTLEVHHALVDGEHVGAYFAAVQSALDGF